MRAGWTADGYARNAGFVAELGRSVVEILAPQAGERILDLGCGDGTLTREIARSGAGVVGADASPELVAAARAGGSDARLLDGHALPFAAEFDAVFSNAALHWMRRPADVLAGVRRALRPGGRFVAEMGGHGNCAAIRTAIVAVLARYGIDGTARDPWYFPTAAAYREQLEAAGFVVTYIASFARPTPLPTGMEGWLRTFAAPFFDGMPAAMRDAAVRDIVHVLRHTLHDDDAGWNADYVRLRFAARRPQRESRGIPTDSTTAT